MLCDCQRSVALPRGVVGLSVVNPDDTRSIFSRSLQPPHEFSNTRDSF